MIATLLKIFFAICRQLNTIGTILGAIAFLFNIGKIYNFVVSFHYMPKAHFKALLARFDLSVDEMKLISEFLDVDGEGSFIDFLAPKPGRRFEVISGATLRLPTVVEQTAIIALRNKGLLMVGNPDQLGSGNEAVDRDASLADSVITDLFRATFL